MAAAGTLESLGRFELIDGVLVKMSPAKSPHGFVLSRLLIRLSAMLGERYELGTDIGVFFGDITMRAPDISLCPIGMEPGFMQPEEVHLAIEIAASTLDGDLKGKAKLYARAGLPEYWVVDIDGRIVHRHREPSGTGYRERAKVGWSEEIAPLCAPDAVLVMADVTKGLRL